MQTYAQRWDMKSFLCLFLLLCSTLAFANGQPLNVKERLRLSLWYQGLKEELPQQNKIAKTKRLPESLERSLRKI